MKNTSLLTIAEYLNGMAARSWKPPLWCGWDDNAPALCKHDCQVEPDGKCCRRLPINSAGPVA